MSSEIKLSLKTDRCVSNATYFDYRICEIDLISELDKIPNW